MDTRLLMLVMRVWACLLCLQNRSRKRFIWWYH